VRSFTGNVSSTLFLVQARLHFGEPSKVESTRHNFM